MWVCTNFGFFSATQRTDKKPAQLLAEGDNRTLQIRARHSSHLEALGKIMGDQLGPVIELKNRDYQARAYATPEAWGRALAEMSTGIDYGNFKNSVKNHKLHDAYMKVWNAMAAVYGTGYDHSWTNYAAHAKPTTDHVYVPSSSRGWCAVKVNDKQCRVFEQDHMKAAPATPKPAKKGSLRASNGRFATAEQATGTGWTSGTDAYRQPALTSSASSYSWGDGDVLVDDTEDIEEETNTDPAFMSLAKAASKVGCPTRQLRDWMVLQSVWKDYQDGNAWFIPVDMIDELEFKYWAEVGR